MKIKGYKVEGRRARGSSTWYWYVKDASGKIVGSVEVSPHTNQGGSFCSSLSSGVTVTAHGPAFHEAQERLADSGMRGHDIYLAAKVAADKTGHEKVWSSHAAGRGTMASRLSEGREIARTEAWPWLISILEGLK